MRTRTPAHHLAAQLLVPSVRFTAGGAGLKPRVMALDADTRPC
ncbi:hypothetical protein [Streptomyces puniciscabiei]